MSPTHLMLINIWFFILGLILALYVVLDGFDLGLGILSLFSGGKGREMMMSSLSTVWDANETWLVIFGGALFGAFPLAYGVVLNAFYIPVLVLLVGLIFRAVAFEFHGHAKYRWFWDFAFGLGSLVVTVAQGIIAGGLLTGVSVDATGMFAGGLLEWANPYIVPTVAGVVLGYAMVGATYMIMRTKGERQRRYFRLALIMAMCSGGAAIATVFFLPALHELLIRQWTRGVFAGYLYTVAGCVLIAVPLFLRAIVKRQEHAPFFWSIAIFLLTFSGVWLGVYPYIVPGSVTLQAAAAPAITLVVMLAGIGLLIPAILFYNGYVYVVFREKFTGRAYGDE